MVADRTLCVRPLYARMISALAHLVFAFPVAGFAWAVTTGGLHQLVVAASAVSVAAIVYRANRLVLVADQHGVEIVNFWRTRKLSWSQIGRVGIEARARFFSTDAPFVSHDAIFFTHHSTDPKIYAEATMSTVMRPEQRQEILDEIIRRAARQGVPLRTDALPVAG